MICQRVKKNIHAHVNTFRSGLEQSRYYKHTALE